MNTERIINLLKDFIEFNDVYDITEDMTNQEKGYLFELITYYMYKLCPALNANLQFIWLYKDIPANVIKELGLPSKDKGIDLLAMINGDYYAIQCKFRQDADRTIHWNELATFFGLSFGMNDKIKRGILVTNTEELCNEVLRSTKVDAIYGEFFDNLPNDFFEKMCNMLSGQRVNNYIRKEMNDPQFICLLKVWTHFKRDNNTRGNIELACGVGKTLFGFFIDRHMRNKKTVIFVPSLYLLSQTYTEWINQSYAENIKIKYILIGSDADVSDEHKYKANAMFLLCTDPATIRKHINNTPNYQKLVVISTYQSANKLVEACNIGTKIKFDFGIYDEAHRTVGQIGKQFSLTLTDDKLNIKKRLYMTATRRFYAGGLDEDDDNGIYSMDNVKIYGENIYCYNIGQAIADKRLVDYQLITMVATNKEIEEYIKQNKLVSYKDEFSDEESHYLGTIIMLLKKIHDGTCNHMITYHNNVKRAVKFKKFMIIINELLYKDKNVYIDSIDGGTSMVKRNRILRDFNRRDKALLSSVRVLGEGVNIPIIDSLCFVDAKNSTIDIIQCIGRSLRLYNNKQMAHVIVPTFIESLDDDFDKNVYGNIIRILQALKSTDEGVNEYFTVNDSGKRANCVKRKICKHERFVEVNKNIEIDLQKWGDNISAKIWDIVNPFDSMMDKVSEWIDKNKKRPSSYTDEYVEKKYGMWLSNNITRYKRKECNMKNNNVRKKFNDFLERYQNVLMSRDCAWIIMRNEVTSWINKNGKRPTCISSDLCEKKYGRWIAGNIRTYNCVTHNKTDNNKRILWDEFVNTHKEYFLQKDTIWERKYQQLLKYINDNNNLPSPRSKDDTEKKCGVWMNANIGRYKNNKMSISEKKLWEKFMNDNCEHLNSNKNRWYEMLEKTKLYLHKYNKRPSVKSKNKNTYSLGKWITRQIAFAKEKEKNTTNNKKHCIMDEEIYNDWCKFVNTNSKYFLSNSDKWNSSMLSVLTFIDKYGKRPSCESKDNEIKKIGQWISSQISNYSLHKGAMTDITRRKHVEDLITKYPNLFDTLCIKNKETIIKETFDSKIQNNDANNIEYIEHASNKITTKQDALKINVTKEKSSKIERDIVVKPKKSRCKKDNDIKRVVRAKPHVATKIRGKNGVFVDCNDV